MNQHLSNKTRLLIFEYKERFPILSAKEVSEIFSLKLYAVERLFKKGEIIIPSKMNSNK
jgi:hypothetical protein